MKEIVVASNNEGKIKEIKEILENYTIISMKEAGINIDIEENEETFVDKKETDSFTTDDESSNSQEINIFAEDTSADPFTSNDPVEEKTKEEKVEEAKKEEVIQAPIETDRFSMFTDDEPEVKEEPKKTTAKKTTTRKTTTRKKKAEEK